MRSSQAQAGSMEKAATFRALEESPVDAGKLIKSLRGIPCRLELPCAR